MIGLVYPVGAGGLGLIGGLWDGSLGVACHVMGEDNWSTMRVMNTLANLYEAQERSQVANIFVSDTLHGRPTKLGTSC